MPRKLRFALPGYTQHVIQRGNNRVYIFADAMDRRVYMDMLAKAGAGQTSDIHAYVLMTNHVHLLLTPPIAERAAKNRFEARHQNQKDQIIKRVRVD